MTPHDRLAAALRKVWIEQIEDGGTPARPDLATAKAILAADPTIAADLDDAPRLWAENERLREALGWFVGPDASNYFQNIPMDLVLEAKARYARAALTEDEEPYAAQDYEGPYRKGGWEAKK